MNAEHAWLHPQDRRALRVVQRLPGHRVLSRHTGQAQMRFVEEISAEGEQVGRRDPLWRAFDSARRALGMRARPDLVLVDRPFVRAFAISGPQPMVGITAGTVELAGRLNALPGVFGHELGHLMADHSAGRAYLALVRKIGIVGVMAAPLLTLAAQAGFQAAVRTWMRYGELSADRAGAIAGGYAESLRLMAVLGEDEGHAPAPGTDLLAELESVFETHPPFRERRAALEAWQQRDPLAGMAAAELAELEDEPLTEDFEDVAAAELAEFDDF